MSERAKSQPTEVELMALDLWARDNPGCVGLIEDFRSLRNVKQKAYIEKAKEELSKRLRSRG